MKKTLVCLLLSGLSFITLTSPHIEEPYVSLINQINNSKKISKKDSIISIPCINELRKIEKTKYDLNSNNCIDKALEYQKILNENKEISYLVAGWVYGYEKGHAWIYWLNKKTNNWCILDPTWKDEQDGLPLEFYSTRYPKYIFNKRVSLRHIKERKNYIIKFQENIKKHKKFRDNLK